jgi:hypothetical protein
LQSQSWPTIPGAPVTATGEEAGTEMMRFMKLSLWRNPSCSQTAIDGYRFALPSYALFNQERQNAQAAQPIMSLEEFRAMFPNGIRVMELRDTHLIHDVNYKQMHCHRHTKALRKRVWLCDKGGLQRPWPAN